MENTGLNTGLNPGRPSEFQMSKWGLGRQKNIEIVIQIPAEDTTADEVEHETLGAASDTA